LGILKRLQLPAYDDISRRITAASTGAPPGMAAVVPPSGTLLGVNRRGEKLENDTVMDSLGTD
jgi:hypothetical protein